MLYYKERISLKSAALQLAVALERVKQLLKKYLNPLLKRCRLN